MTVNEYLDSLPADQKKLLSSIRKTIRETCPEADETIGYHMPGYKYLGKPLLYFAAYKHHCSLFGVSKKMFTEFKEELSGFEIVGSTIHFSVEHPLPVSLMKKIIKSRMKENESHFTKKL